MTMEMEVTLAFSEEQAELLEVAQSFCRDKSPIPTVRRLIEDELGYDPGVWAEMARLGWLGIVLSAEANEADAPCISTEGSLVEVRIIPTDEEAMLAAHCREVIGA